MGNCCGCLRGYRPILDSSTQNQNQDRSESSELLLQNGSYNFNLSIFKGLAVDQKFTNSSTFEKKFIWVNYETRTLHMSQHMSKEGRHKEASLIDVKSLSTNTPTKLKRGESSDNHFLTIGFVRGGSIDLRFQTTYERDIWYNTLTKMVNSIKSDENDIKS